MIIYNLCRKILFLRSKQASPSPPLRSISQNCRHFDGKPTSSHANPAPSGPSNIPPSGPDGAKISTKSPLAAQFSPLLLLVGPRMMARSLRRLPWCPCAPWHNTSTVTPCSLKIKQEEVKSLVTACGLALGMSSDAAAQQGSCRAVSFRFCFIFFVHNSCLLLFLRSAACTHGATGHECGGRGR